MDNPQPLATLDTQDTGRRQKKHKYITQKVKRMTITTPPKTMVNLCEGQDVVDTTYNTQTNTNNIHSIWALLQSHEDEKSLNIPKGVIRIRKSKDRQHNGQQKMYRKRNNDLQWITHITKDRVRRTTLKTGEGLRCSGRVCSSCSTSDTRKIQIVCH
jgi:hypothetical protein